jgi:hypothetical protein
LSERLERRIAAALSDEAVTSAALLELIQETDAALVTADASVEEERERAMDPAISPDAKAARQAMEDAAFAASRLRTLQPRLRKHHERVACAERKRAWVERYNELRLEHDAAVGELKDLYPPFVAKMVDLLTRIRELDARTKTLMDAKPHPEAGEPDDGRWLPMVECAARGLNGMAIGGQWDARLSLDKHLILPDFNDATTKVWPPHRPAWI